MKKVLLAILAICGAMATFAQDSTAKRSDTARNEKVDTIRVGGMIIIKKGDKSGSRDRDVIFSTEKNKKKKNSNLSTNWWILDLGFANLHDETNYTAPAAQAFVGPGVGKDQLELRTGKSVNVNIWFFMQRLNLVKHVVNLKYGLGLELNNYRFDNEQVRLLEDPAPQRIVLDPTLDRIRKNKLAADYVTVPVMLNFNLTPNRKRGFGFSAGVSGGYLYSARQKFKDGDDKDKVKDNFDLRKWKVAYIGELSLGPVRLYGSYARKSLWRKGLEQTPYTVGIRLSHF